MITKGKIEKTAKKKEKKKKKEKEKKKRTEFPGEELLGP